MRSKILVLGVVTALLISGTAAFAAVPSMAAGSAGDSKEITECTVIDGSGHYDIVTDITNDSAETCISANSGATIDGNGHTVDGVNMNGTGIAGAGSVTNVTITGFDTGAAYVSELSGVTLTENEQGALTRMKTMDITDSTISNNTGDGVEMSTTEGSYFGNNTFVDNGGAGVDAGAQTGFTAENNYVANNAEGGFSGSETWITSRNNVVVNNDVVGIGGGTGAVDSTNDVVKNTDGAGLSSDTVVATNATLSGNEYGVQVTTSRMFGAGLNVSDSTIVDNTADGIYVSGNAELSTAEVHNSVISGNDGLGINVSLAGAMPDDGTTRNVNATNNYWGSDDGPSSPADVDAPLEDPETGALADGSGDEVSENDTNSGVSNIHFDSFLTENPNADDENDENPEDGDESEGDDGDEGDEGDDEQPPADDGGNETDGDDGDETEQPPADDGDDSDENENENDDSDESDGDNGDESEGDDGDETEQPPADDSNAYQLDVVKGEVIETLGDDENDFYGAQGRLLQAKSVTADGDITRTHDVPQGTATVMVDGSEVSYNAVSYDEETGEVSVMVSLSEDASDDLTVTLAAYELPGDDTEFVRENADGQELRDHQTATLSPGDSMTITIDVDGE